MFMHEKQPTGSFGLWWAYVYKNALGVVCCGDWDDRTSVGKTVGEAVNVITSSVFALSCTAYLTPSGLRFLAVVKLFNDGLRSVCSVVPSGIRRVMSDYKEHQHLQNGASRKGTAF